MHHFDFYLNHFIYTINIYTNYILVLKIDLNNSETAIQKNKISKMDRSRTKLVGQISRKERINYVICVWLILKRMNTFSSNLYCNRHIRN